MVHKSLLSFVVLAAAIFQNIEETHAIEMKCKGQPVTMTEQQINNMKGCAKTVGIDSPDKLSPDKIGCFSKCIMEKKELIDADGKPHKENIIKLIDSSIPEIAREEFKTATAECLDAHGGKIDPKDASCASYIPLAMCHTSKWTQICKP